VTATATATPFPTQALFAGSCHDEAMPSSATWLNPPNAAGPPNGQTADVNLTFFQQSDRLVCDNFGFTLPPNAKVVDIKVRMVRGMTATTGFQALDLSVLLRTNGKVSDDRSFGSPIPPGANVVQFPQPPTNGDVWGFTNLTAADVNSPSFAVMYQSAKIRASGSPVERVDSVEVIVTYI